MIASNPDKVFFKEISAKVEKNDGYCPCKIIKTPDTRCPCKEFREQKEGFCHCKRYYKTNS